MFIYNFMFTRKFNLPVLLTILIELLLGKIGAVFNWQSNEISIRSGFAACCFLVQSELSKTDVNHDSLAHIFPRFASATCLHFEFWLVHCIVCVLCDWLRVFALILVSGLSIESRSTVHIQAIAVKPFLRSNTTGSKENVRFLQHPYIAEKIDRLGTKIIFSSDAVSGIKQVSVKRDLTNSSFNLVTCTGSKISHDILTLDSNKQRWKKFYLIFFCLTDIHQNFQSLYWKPIGVNI